MKTLHALIEMMESWKERPIAEAVQAEPAITTNEGENETILNEKNEPELHLPEEKITWIFEEGGFAPMGKIQGEESFSIITDYLGTPCQMYNDRGRKTWECELDIYGKIRYLKSTRSFNYRQTEEEKRKECPFRYQGQYEDVETGLYYNRFRYYDPEDGVYVSQDPIGLAGGSRLYNYVNDVNSKTDIFGLKECLNGTAIIHHSPGNARNPYGHYSIEIIQSLNDKMHTHQTILSPDLSKTTIERIFGKRNGVTNSIPIKIPNVKNALKYQEKMLGKQLGAYNPMTNSCVDHVCEVLRSGGIDIPKSALGQMKFLKGLGF